MQTQAQNTTTQGPVLDRLISFEDACKRYHLSKSTLYKKTSARVIPAYKMGGKLFFDPVEVDELMLTRGRIERVEG